MPPNNSGSTRSRQLSRQERIADRLDIDPNDVAVRDTLDRGTDASLTSEGATAAERQARREFASEADFVSRQDVAANADRQALSVSARIAEGRRDDVEQRAESGVAEDREYVTPADLDADVGRRGVEGVAIPEEQRDDVEQRAVSDAASDTDFVTPADLDADVGRRGVSGVSIADSRKDDVEQRAEQSFASQSENITTADVDADVGETGVSEVSIPEERQDDVAARVRQQLLSNNEAAKASDITVSVSESGIEEAGFREGAQRDIAARQIDQQFSNVNVDGDDIKKSGDAFKPTESVLQRSAAASEGDETKTADPSDLKAFLSETAGPQAVEDLSLPSENEQFDTGAVLRSLPSESVPFDDNEFLRDFNQLTKAIRNSETIDPSNFAGVDGPDPSPSDFEVETTVDGSEITLTDEAQRERAASQIDAELGSVDVSAGDIRRSGDSFRPRDAVLKRAATEDVNDRVDPSTADLTQYLQSQFDSIGAGNVSTEEFSQSIVNNEQSASYIESTLREAVPPKRSERRVDNALALRDAIRTGGTVDANRFDTLEGEIEATPSELELSVGADRQTVTYTDSFARERAASQFDQQFDTEIGVGDITASDNGFGLADRTQRTVAADRLEEQTPIEQIDPQNDLEQQPDGDGFALAGSAQREFAASQFEEQTPLDNINPNTGLTRSEGGFGLSTIGQRRLAAEQFEQQTSLDDVTRWDVELADGGAILESNKQKQIAAEKLDERVDGDITVDDVEAVTTPDGDTEFTLDEGVLK